MTESEQKSKLAFNIICNMAAVAISSVCLFIGDWAVIKYFGMKFHGDLTWIMAMSWILCLISDFGLAGNAGVRSIARLRAKGTGRLNSAISLMFFIPLVLAVVLAGGDDSFLFSDLSIAA